jgi:hypothetical protein
MGICQRCGSEVSGGGCQIFAKVEIVDDGSNCQQLFTWWSRFVYLLIKNYLLIGQGMFTCWPRITYLLVKACLLVGQGSFTYWSMLVYLLAKIVYFLIKT